MTDYTAKLEDWYVDISGSICGNIYGDSKDRFKDGSPIKTSYTLPMSMQVSSPKEGIIIFTRNSSYLLGKHRY